MDNDTKEIDDTKEIGCLALIIGGVVLAIVLAIVSAVGCARMVHRVPAGHVAVVYGFGGDITGQRDAGLQFTAPWQSVKEVSVQRQTYRPETDCANGQKACIETFSKDNQDVFVSATLTYHIDPEKV